VAVSQPNAEERKQLAEEAEQVFARRAEQERVNLGGALGEALRAEGRGLQCPQDGFDVLPRRARKPPYQAFFFPMDATANSVTSRACSRARCL
jgi:hypothetical protein